MLRALSSAIALGAAYLCSNPTLVGNFGLELQLRRCFLLTWLAKQLYRSTSSVFELINQSYPNSDADEIARFEWFGDRDAELVAKVQGAVSELKLLQQNEVPLDPQTSPYLEMFNEIKLSYSKFENWHDLGFQGQNPATDFRGAGKLGVLMFHGFCTKRPRDLQKLIAESRSTTKVAANEPWYPLALVSIRLTNAMCELLKREKMLVLKLLQQMRNIRESTSPWLNMLQMCHDQMLFQLHSTWLEAERKGEIASYFDNEKVLKGFEKSLSLRIYRLYLGAK